MMAFAILLAASAPTELPPLTGSDGRPTLLGLYDSAYWAAYPGCKSFVSKRSQHRFDKLIERLNSNRNALVLHYGSDVLVQYEDEHADTTHGVHYTKCPSVNDKFLRNLRRTIESLEKHMQQPTLER